MKIMLKGCRVMCACAGECLDYACVGHLTCTLSSAQPADTTLALVAERRRHLTPSRSLGPLAVRRPRGAEETWTMSR